MNSRLPNLWHRKRDNGKHLPNEIRMERIMLFENTSTWITVWLLSKKAVSSIGNVFSRADG